MTDEPLVTPTPLAQHDEELELAVVIDRRICCYEQQLVATLPSESIEQILVRVLPMLPKDPPPVCVPGSDELSLVDNHRRLMSGLHALRTCVLDLISCRDDEASGASRPAPDSGLRRILSSRSDFDLLQLAEQLTAANLKSCNSIDTSSLEQAMETGDREALLDAIVGVFPSLLENRWQMLVSLAQWLQGAETFDPADCCNLQAHLSELTELRSILERVLVRVLVRQERERFLSAQSKSSSHAPSIAEQIALARSLELKPPPHDQLENEHDAQTNLVFDQIEAIKKKTFAQEDIFCDRVGEAIQSSKRERQKKVEECRQERLGDTRRVRDFLAQYQDIDEADRLHLLDLYLRNGPSQDELADIAAKVREKRRLKATTRNAA